jgi:hypothetical protein
VGICGQVLVICGKVLVYLLYYQNERMKYFSSFERGYAKARPHTNSTVKSTE